MSMSESTPRSHSSRRSFLKQAALSGAAFARIGLSTPASASSPAGASSAQQKPAPKSPAPWYRRTFRWGQTNITEADPEHYDIGWWRGYWRRTRIQGVIINAGGIVAYYPSQDPLQYRAKLLGDRDLYGELVQAAHADGLAVLARMDSNRVHEDFYRAHPEWMARDAGGNAYRAGDLYVTCINSGYYQEWIPSILREIIERTHPEGVTDNSWSGLGRGNICHCDNCSRRFQESTGKALPARRNWRDPVYRDWIRWNYARRLEIWDLNNRTTQAAGGPDCLWVGMNSGSVSGQAQSFRPYKEICERAEIILLDHQARSDAAGFQQNAESGALIHGLLGWDKLVPESMAMYQAGRPTFRKASKPEPEARLWALEGFAGGIQPWWHHVGANQEDRRQFHTIESLNRWHEANEDFLTRRRPLATVGVVWSQQNVDFYGQDHAEELVELPWRGMLQALLRARIPCVPLHADHIQRDGAGLALLILPHLAAMSDAQVEAVRQFVEGGGGLLATGETSLFTEEGDPKRDFALADLFGAHLPADREVSTDSARARQAAETLHTYLRISPETGGSGSTARPPVLAGFEETDILPFGGSLESLSLERGSLAPLTFVPPFPIYPPETSWMREPRTDIPGLVLNTRPNGSRVAFLPADLDRRFARDNLPDHGQLLANLARWAAKEDFPLKVEGRGLVDCRLYSQPGRLILHVVNLTNAGTWRQPVHELIPIGPLTLRVRLPAGVAGRKLRLLVSGQTPPLVLSQGWSRFDLNSVLDHEVAIIE